MYAFVHIPKCAGTYIEKDLGMWRNKQCLFGPDGKGDFLQHMTWTQIMNLKKGKFDPNDFYKFTFVRNPYTRLISDYHWCKGWFKHKWVLNSDNAKVGFKSFDEYIYVIQQHYELRSPENIWSHFRPAYEFVYDKDLSLQVDFVGHVENFQDDYSHVLENIGKTKKDTVMKKTPKRYNIQEYYNQESLNIVNELFKKDFEVFGYEMSEVQSTFAC